MDERYSRQVRFAHIGKTGQQRIIDSHVLIVGLGALGSQCAELLVRAGIGHLYVVDRDYVDVSNLQRQTLYSEQDALQGIPKAIAAKNRLSAINSSIEIKAFVEDVTPSFLQQFTKVDIIIDATDNFDIRFMLNDFAYKYKIPWIYGACVASYGVSNTFLPEQQHACLRCLMKKIPLGGTSCDTMGVISSVVSQVVSWQVTETLKIIVGDYDALRGTLQSVDLWANDYASIDVRTLVDQSCTSCSSKATYPYLIEEQQVKVAILCGRDTVQIRSHHLKNIDLQQVKKTVTASITMANDYLIAFMDEEQKVVVFLDGRVFIHHTSDMIVAKKIFYRHFS
ncbi:ThiF family adenylyltransferase [Kurthia sibirica]|uniref:Thiamine biosynthesis protein MoeB n=1 Tax=Kurthia sibirica TaxID=202750 RepID=A0A2U3ALJ6_9BACL|nr:ThiF family adenylyltransferase [Kurthia sibirica]PWI25423.1 thiamine biosynthesis protein MoeB [Kurthia sibirica]GEK34341.1 thiazole biosynthesis adenylyltransferase ThiF [Kurthia sibirica]